MKKNSTEPDISNTCQGNIYGIGYPVNKSITKIRYGGKWYWLTEENGYFNITLEDGALVSFDIEKIPAAHPIPQPDQPSNTVKISESYHNSITKLLAENEDLKEEVKEYNKLCEDYLMESNKLRIANRELLEAAERAKDYLHLKYPAEADIFNQLDKAISKHSGK